MQIIYRYSKDIKEENVWRELEIDRCSLKQISFSRDRTRITKKRHFHTELEIHIIQKGYQEYEIDGEFIRVPMGSYLAIRPGVMHTVATVAPETEKLALCFRPIRGSALSVAVSAMKAYSVAPVPGDISSVLFGITRESEEKDRYSTVLAGCGVLECVVQWIRILTDIPKPERREAPQGDGRVALAKQYVEDNVASGISLSELASYCCISEKQLTRLFLLEENMSVSEYVRRKRCEYIERLLADSDASLSRISELAGFSSEYYFNAFYKKNTGMTPGAHRRALKGE